jgi:hypothetical protein
MKTTGNRHHHQFHSRFFCQGDVLVVKDLLKKCRLVIRMLITLIASMLSYPYLRTVSFSSCQVVQAPECTQITIIVIHEIFLCWFFCQTAPPRPTRHPKKQFRF